MNYRIITYEFCELKRTISDCYKCVYCGNILCLDCCFGDDVTPDNKYKKLEHTDK